MKRIGGLYYKLCSINNLALADKKARKGKKDQYGIQLHDKNGKENLLILHEMLVNKTYKTSLYTSFKVYDPKEREVFRLPYFPDRITHHAIMNIMEPIFVATFTKDTYSCIKGRGIHKASYALRKVLSNDMEGTKYCLKIDIQKFYPSINHDILKSLLRRKIKDKDLLWLLDEIIDSAEGVPIGNYLSQYFANFYLSYFDHFVKEVLKVKYYFRYADDMVFLSDSKIYLHELLANMRKYLLEELKLVIKKNYQVFPVESRGIDFVGYPVWHDHVLLRPNIKKKFARAVYRRKNKQTIASYRGWAQHCDSRHLLKKLSK